MDVKLVLKNWKIIQDEKTKAPKIAGRYAVMIGEKEVACQDFNDGYQGKELPFSWDTINSIMAVEGLIKAELEKMLT